jgi:hypothetical protein
MQSRRSLLQWRVVRVIHDMADSGWSLELTVV